MHQFWPLPYVQGERERYMLKQIIPFILQSLKKKKKGGEVEEQGDIGLKWSPKFYFLTNVSRIMISSNSQIWNLIHEFSAS